jgi:cysteine synthase
MDAFTDRHKADSVIELIGHTPVVRLRRVVRECGATVWAKLKNTALGAASRIASPYR